METETKGVTANTKKKKIIKVSLLVFLLILSVFVPELAISLMATCIFWIISFTLIYTYVPANKGKFPLFDRLEEAIGKRLQALIDKL